MRQIFWSDGKITEKISIENKDQRKMAWPKQLTQNFVCEQNHFLIAGSISVLYSHKHHYTLPVSLTKHSPQQQPVNIHKTTSTLLFFYHCVGRTAHSKTQTTTHTHTHTVQRINAHTQTRTQQEAIHKTDSITQNVALWAVWQIWWMGWSHPLHRWQEESSSSMWV